MARLTETQKKKQLKASEQLKTEVDKHGELEKQKNAHLAAAQEIAGQQIRVAARVELMNEQIAEEFGDLHPDILAQLPQDPVG